MENNYRIVKAVRSEKKRIVEHTVLLPNQTDYSFFRYYALRIGLVWPTVESPGYFLVGGAEEYDEVIVPADRAQVRIIEQHEIPDLALGTLFDAVTSAYVAYLCDAIYVDFEHMDYKLGLFDYLSRNNMRTVSVYDVPYRDVVYRLGVVGDYNDSGELIVDKDTQLFRDLQGVSRTHLLDKPESKYYRLNALSYLLSGFSKYNPKPPALLKMSLGGKSDWML